MKKALHVLFNAVCVCVWHCKEGPLFSHFLPEKYRDQRMFNKEQRTNSFPFVTSWIKNRDRMVKHLLL